MKRRRQRPRRRSPLGVHHPRQARANGSHCAGGPPPLVSAGAVGSARALWALLPRDACVLFFMAIRRGTRALDGLCCFGRVLRAARVRCVLLPEALHLVDLPGGMLDALVRLSREAFALGHVANEPHVTHERSVGVAHVQDAHLGEEDLA